MIQIPPHVPSTPPIMPGDIVEIEGEIQPLSEEDRRNGWLPINPDGSFPYPDPVLNTEIPTRH